MLVCPPGQVIQVCIHLVSLPYRDSPAVCQLYVFIHPAILAFSVAFAEYLEMIARIPAPMHQRPSHEIYPFPNIYSVDIRRATGQDFLDRFPDISTLAAASQDDVLRQWQGLGYYSRARNLHEAVREVAASYGGKVPKNKKDILALKGVGDYTAGAILSIAYGEAEAAVDGNVLRVFARLYNIDGNILSGPVKKEITALVQAQIPQGRAGAFNEALMDFGAMICIPKHPRCGECPLADICMAKRAGREQELPVRIVKKKVPTEPVTVVVVEDKGRWRCQSSS